MALSFQREEPPANSGRFKRSLADFRWIPAPEPGAPRKQKILEIGGEGG
jgi:hypothetical protein